MTAKQLYFYLNELNVDGKLKSQNVKIVEVEVGLSDKEFVVQDVDWDSESVVIRVKKKTI